MNVIVMCNDRLFQVWQQTFIASPYWFKIPGSCYELGICHIKKTTQMSEYVLVLRVLFSTI